MQSELFFKKRTLARTEKRLKRRSKTPYETISATIAAITISFIEDHILNDRDLLRANNINLDFDEINYLIEQKLSEKQMKNLNPTALIAGYIVLGRDKNIDPKKIDFIFKGKSNNIPIIDFFHNQNINEEDIIRYARLWNHLLS